MGGSWGKASGAHPKAGGRGGRGPVGAPPPDGLAPSPGMTGILLCAAGLPVCLTRAPKPILHPPPVSKSDVKPVPGVPGVCRKTKKKHLKKSTPSTPTLTPLT